MSASAPHTAKALLFTCMDERLEPAIETSLHALPGGAFHAALAGGGAAFITEPDAQVALKQVVAAFKINHVTSIFLQSHMECGAYALAGVKFTSETEEAARLYADLEAAKAEVLHALTDAGAAPGEVTVYASVVTLAGETVKQPELSHIA